MEAKDAAEKFWLSISQHVCNNHTQCTHETITDRQDVWLTPDMDAFKVLESLVASKQVRYYLSFNSASVASDVQIYSWSHAEQNNKSG